MNFRLQTNSEIDAKRINLLFSIFTMTISFVFCVITLIASSGGNAKGQGYSSHSTIQSRQIKQKKSKKKKIVLKNLHGGKPKEPFNYY